MISKCGIFIKIKNCYNISLHTFLYFIHYNDNDNVIDILDDYLFCIDVLIMTLRLSIPLDRTSPLALRLQVSLLRVPSTNSFIPRIKGTIHSGGREVRTSAKDRLGRWSDLSMFKITQALTWMKWNPPPPHPFSIV